MAEVMDQIMAFLTPSK